MRSLSSTPASMTVSAQTFAEHKQFLWGMCYRMTGNAADADDIVQDTFVKAMETPPPDMQAPLRPWLVKVALNLSRDQLRRRRRREYFGPWLPTPVEIETEDMLPAEQNDSAMTPMARYELMESVTLAFLLALEALTPTQRAVLLLRDVFDYSTNEVAKTLDMTESNVKVTLHRARSIMSAYDKDRSADRSSSNVALRRTLEQFVSRLVAGDVEGVEQMLADDVMLVTDGGGEINALAEPVYGRENVLRLITKLYEANRDIMTTEVQELNGQPAVLITRSEVKPRHASFFTMHCELDDATSMRRLHFVFAPSKLRALHHTSLKV